MITSLSNDGSIIAQVLEGCFSYSKHVTNESSKKYIQKCIKRTANLTKIDQSLVKSVIYSPYYLSIASFDLLPDMETIEKLLREGKRDEIYYINVHKYIQPDLLEKVVMIKKIYEPSDEWYDLQRKYIEGLSEEEQLIIIGYTKRIDKVANAFLRGEPIKPEGLITLDTDNYIFYYHERLLDIYKAKNNKHDLESFLEYYTKTLDRIILESPETDKEFVVYRGKHLLSRNDKMGTIVNQKGFSSSSANLYNAIVYANPYSEMPSSDEDYLKPLLYKFFYVEKIIVPKGSHVLSIGSWITFYSHDPEILFPDSSNFEVVRTCKTQELYYIYSTNPSYQRIEGSPKWSGNMCLLEFISK